MVDGMNNSAPQPQQAGAPQPTITVVCYKAPTMYGKLVPNLQILSRDEFPDFSATHGTMAPAAASALHRQCGTTLAEVLLRCLPLETMDCLLIELLDRKRTQLVVAAGGGA